VNVAEHVDLDSMDPQATLLALGMRKFVKQWPSKFLAVLHQTFRGALTLEDAYLLALVWHELQQGNVFVKRFRLQSGPNSDSEIKLNRAVLQAARIDFQLTCEKGRGADDDGWVRLREPRGFIVAPSWEPCSLPQAANRYLPLEVGDTHIGNLYFHLVRNQGFVRWPYGDSCLHIWMLGEPLGIGL